MAKKSIWADESRAKRVSDEIAHLAKSNEKLINRLFYFEKDLPFNLRTGRTLSFSLGIIAGSIVPTFVFINDIQWGKWIFMVCAGLSFGGAMIASLACMTSSTNTPEKLQDWAIQQFGRANGKEPIYKWTNEDIVVMDRLLQLEYELHGYLKKPGKIEAKIVHLGALVDSVRARVHTEKFGGDHL